jgi:hypothetical protein
MSVIDLLRRLSGSLLLCGLAAVVACGGDGESTERVGKREDGEPRLVSPSDGAVVRVGWIPLFVRLREPFLDARVRATLDGRDVTDPLGVFSFRQNHPEVGNYIATLEFDDVEPGAHRLEVEFEAESGEMATVSSTFTWDRPRCPVVLEVVDGRREPSSARVAVFRDGEPYLLIGPDADAVDPKSRDTQLHSVFVVGGRKRLFLDPGDYRFLAVRGIRHDVAERSVTLGAECVAPTDLLFELPEVVPTPGFLTADFHVHTGRSSDSYIPDALRYRSLVAADLDVFVVTEHNRITNPAAALASVRPPGDVSTGLTGVEARMGPRVDSDGRLNKRVGHANIFPIVPGAALPPSESSNLATHIDNYRERQGRQPHPQAGSDLLVQLNHPRGLSVRPDDRRDWTPAYALFNYIGFDRKVPVGQGSNAWLTAERPGTGTTPLDFDALEVLNRFSWGPYRQVRADWFLLMNLGRFHTGTGNSDSHAVAVELAGFPVNLVHAPGAREDGELDAQRFIDAVRDGHVTVSTGPIVTLRVVGGDRAAGPGEMLAARSVTVKVEVRAAPWVPVAEVRVVVNGHVTGREAVEPAARGIVNSWTIKLERDSWILAEAGWPIDAEAPDATSLGDYARIAPGYVPLGFTNPVRIDFDNDGVWTPFDPELAAELAAPMPEHGPKPRQNVDLD